MTDPEARSMRFPDGAVGPAYNAQIAAAPKEGVIVSIDVADRRNEAGLAGPMVNDIVRRLTPLSVDQPNTVDRASLTGCPRSRALQAIASRPAIDAGSLAWPGNSI